MSILGLVTRRLRFAATEWCAVSVNNVEAQALLDAVETTDVVRAELVVNAVAWHRRHTQEDMTEKLRRALAVTAVDAGMSLAGPMTLEVAWNASHDGGWVDEAVEAVPDDVGALVRVKLSCPTRPLRVAS